MQVLSLRERNLFGNLAEGLTSKLNGHTASLPLVVLNPLLAIGTIVCIPTMVLFLVLYWASTETPLRLNID